MLTYDQYNPVPFTLEQYHLKFLWKYLLQRIWKLYILNQNEFISLQIDLVLCFISGELQKVP